MKPTSIRLDDKTLGDIDSLAHAMGRSRAWVIQDALNRYLEYEAWFRAEVRKGFDDIAAGRVLSHEQVKDSIRAMGINVD